MRNRHMSRIALGALAALALASLAACMQDEELGAATDDEQGEVAAGDQAERAIDRTSMSELDQIDEVAVWDEGRPMTAALTTGRARVGWSAAGIDICGDGCFLCFYPNAYDKVFHAGHIVNVVAICGDAAWVRDNHGNDGMMRKDALYNY